MNPKLNKSICQICHEPIIDNKHFYKAHGLKMAEYYEKYFARKDLLTGESILFKSIEHYESADFLNKNNLKKWLKISKPAEVELYLVEILKTRKELKQLTFTPTQVELRSLSNFPSIITYNKVFGDYYLLCEQLGFQSRGFRNVGKNTQVSLDSKFNNPFGDYFIRIDSREQKPLQIEYPIEIGALNYGDYGFCKPELTNNIYIERKSLTDAVSSFGNQIERLEKEFARAEKDGAYLVVLVEESLTNCLNFNYLPWISKKIKITPDFLFHNIRNILQKFKNSQFVFVDGRKKAAEMIKFLLFSELARNVDFQLLVDMKII